MDFKTSIEDIDEVTKKIKVSIPADSVDKEVKTELVNIGRQAKVKGFRPGKAPANVIERLHGGRVRMEVAHRLISSSIYDAVRKNEVDMIGEPEIDISSFEPGKDIEYTANVSIFPSPELNGYDSFKVEVEKAEVGDEEVDNVLEQIRQSRATPRKLEFRETAENGDVIDATLKVQVAGEEESPPEPLVVGLGEGTLPKELEEGIIGMNTGETKQINVTYPADHENQALQGKEFTYTVELKGLSEKVLPELNDEFAKNAGLQVETLLELRMKVREQLEKERDENTKADLHGKILDQLVEKNEFKVPQILVDNEIRGLLVRAGIVDPQKLDPAKIDVESFRENLGEPATKRVRTAIAVDRIAIQEKLEVTEDDLKKAISEIAENNGVLEDEVEKYFLDKERRPGFELEQTRGKVLDFLEERTKVKYVKPKPKDEGDDQVVEPEPAEKPKKKAAAKAKKSPAKKAASKKSASA